MMDMTTNIVNVIEAPEPVIDALMDFKGDMDLHKLVKLPAWLTTEEKMEWREENWGTKHKPRQTVRNSPTRVTFTTLGSAPLKAFEKLPEKFPNEMIVYAYAGEDLGTDYALFESDGDGWSSILSVPKGSAVALQFSTMIRTGKTYIEHKVYEIRETISKLSEKGLDPVERELLGTKIMIDKYDLNRLRADLLLFVKSSFGSNTTLDEVDFSKLETYFRF